MHPKCTQNYEKIKMKPRINNLEDKNKTYRGKRGGRYTKVKTKDGRPYRRYF